MLRTKFQQFQALFDVKILASCLIAQVLAIAFYNLNNNNNNNDANIYTGKPISSDKKN